MTEEQKDVEKEVVEVLEDVEETNEDAVAETEEVKEEVSEIERLQAENDALADKVLRAQAELQNVQRRQAKERQDLLKYRSQDLAKKVLPALDNLERALAVDGLTDEVKKGLEMTRDSLVQALKEEGVEEVAMDKFDPNYHMAVQTLPASEEQPADTIVEVFQKGYQLHDRLLRPAMVVIAQ